MRKRRWNCKLLKTYTTLKFLTELPQASIPYLSYHLRAFWEWSWQEGVQDRKTPGLKCQLPPHWALSAFLSLQPAPRPPRFPWPTAHPTPSYSLTNFLRSLRRLSLRRIAPHHHKWRFWHLETPLGNGKYNNYKIFPCSWEMIPWRFSELQHPHLTYN